MLLTGGHGGTWQTGVTRGCHHSALTYSRLLRSRCAHKIWSGRPSQPGTLFSTCPLTPTPDPAPDGCHKSHGSAGSCQRRRIYCVASTVGVKIVSARGCQRKIYIYLFIAVSSPEQKKKRMDEQKKFKRSVLCHVFATLQKRIYYSMGSMCHFRARSQQSRFHGIRLLKCERRVATLCTRLGTAPGSAHAL